MEKAVGAFVIAVLAVIGVLALAMTIGLVMAFPLKWTWNYVMPFEFGLKAISWGQAWCLSFLATTLIKSSLSTTNKSE